MALAWPLIADVVGRIEEGRVHPQVLADHRPQELLIAAIAAADPMLAEDPDVAGLGARRHRHRRNDLVLGIARSLEDHIDLAAGEAGEREIELHIDPGKLAELELEEIEVPAGTERDLVVSEPERALLRLGEAAKRDCRHLGHADATSPPAGGHARR